LLASARTTTQSREIELTHRADRRDFAEAGGAEVIDWTVGLDAAFARIAGVVAGVFDAAGSSRGVVAVVTSPGVVTGTTLSRVMVSALAIIVGDATVSSIVVGAWTVVSRGSGAECDLMAAFVRMLAVSGGSALRRSQAVPTSATSAAAPTPFQTWGPIGARSGLVPHQRHSPRLAR